MTHRSTASLLARRPVNSGAAVVDSKVIVGGTDGSVYMLEQGTDRLLSRLETGKAMHSAVAVADVRFFIGAYKGAYKKFPAFAL